MTREPRTAPTGDEAPVEATRFVLRVETRRIAELHAILEGYDDLAVLRTIRPSEGLVEVWVSPGAEGEFGGLMASLAREGLPTTPVAGA